ncbi:MAG: hypothetical protein B9J98_03485 [Candidatus Terraquivivens tikiterensis]|uniref:Uncharacterized protein n=1 Tax=Candidatus Terraquivivens tikiterensis TaxID=1980982 RepID=A0A2R7Y6K6_9ARCH|nr:MAG: hypothetical protein B9J98_03485 [Candidatus Terraquivivens tikiterensis]
MDVRKTCWISVKVSQTVAKIVKLTASTMGISISEFARQAILEKLERMNLMGSEVKALIAQETSSSDPKRRAGELE